MPYINPRPGSEADALNLTAGHEAENHSASHNDHTISERAGCRSRWCRVRPRRAGVLAVTVGIVLLVAACGGSSSAGSAISSNPAVSSNPPDSSNPAVSSNAGGSSSTGESAQAQQDLAFAQCMRSDGVADFPDPGSNGQFATVSAQLERSPHFAAGFNACKHLLPAGGVSKAQQDQAQLLKFAECMHAHGVPTYPEPGPASPYSVIGPNTAVDELRVAGVNPNSPVVQAAVQTCERENPVGS
jgi:hypothetical protein